jgi:hypothetical protein
MFKLQNVLGGKLRGSTGGRNTIMTLCPFIEGRKRKEN